MLLNQSPTKPEFVFLDLAQSYELPDESTYIFTMRPGVKVTPNDLGVPERDLDAEDVPRHPRSPEDRSAHERSTHSRAVTSTR